MHFYRDPYRMETLTRIENSKTHEDIKDSRHLSQIPCEALHFQGFACRSIVVKYNGVEKDSLEDPMDFKSNCIRIARDGHTARPAFDTLSIVFSSLLLLACLCNAF